MSENESLLQLTKYLLLDDEFSILLLLKIMFLVTPRIHTPFVLYKLLQANNTSEMLRRIKAMVQL